MIRYNSLEEYIDDRIEFIGSVDTPNFYTALRDFKWVKSMIEKDKNGEEVSWDDIITVVFPYMFGTYNMSIENSKHESLPFHIRLEAKRIADDLSDILNDIVLKCKHPFTSCLIFQNKKNGITTT